MTVWFTVPEGFHELDIFESQQERTIRLADALEGLFPERAPEQKMRIILSTEAAIQELISSGTESVFNCLYRTESEHLLSGVLTVSIRSEKFRSREVFVDQTVKSWCNDVPDSAMGIKIPYGPAVVQVLEVDSPVDAVDPSAGSKTMKQQQVSVPLMSCDQFLTFGFMVDTEGAWQDCVEVLQGIVDSVTPIPPEVARDCVPREGQETAKKIREDFG